MYRPLAGLAAAATLAGCTAGGPAGAGDGAPPAPSAPTLASLTVSSGVLRPAFDPAVTDYDVTSLDSLYPVSVTATTPAPGDTLTIHGASAESGVASAFTLAPGEDFTVAVDAPGAPSTTYTIHYLPSDFPAYQVTSAAGAGTEDVLLTLGGYTAIVDRSGALLYYRSFLPQAAEDFERRTLPGGAVVYTVGLGLANPSGWTLGVEHVMDDHFQDTGDYQLPAHAQHGVLPAESHDFRMLGDQHYIAMSYVQRTLDLSAVDSSFSAQAQVMSNVLQEVDHGRVLLEWDSANVPALYHDSTSQNSFGASALSDYLHMNSIDVDPADGNLVVSFRHTSSIVKLDRHTGAILWTLGGKEDQFGLSADQVFSFQHDARMQADGSMTVFDNGNDAHQTRVLSFVLDPVHHQVTSFQVLYTKPADQPQTGFMGSATPLDGGRLLCGWGGWTTMDLAPAATEIVGGAPVWSLEFTMPQVFSYRALPTGSLRP